MKAWPKAFSKKKDLVHSVFLLPPSLLIRQIWRSFGFVFLVAIERDETTARLLSTVFGAVRGSRSSDRRQCTLHRVGPPVMPAGLTPTGAHEDIVTDNPCLPIPIRTTHLVVPHLLYLSISICIQR